MKPTERYPTVAMLLNTLFNVEHGFSEEVSLELYAQTVHESGLREKLQDELRRGFDDSTLPWREMLLNSRYEVFDAQSEDEARAYAHRILWEPLFGK